MSHFPNKSPAPNFANPAVQRSFVDGVDSANELMHKELDVNQAEQNLLQKRILLLKDSIDNLPSSDPQYSMMLHMMNSDKIELDELKIRAAAIRNVLNKN